MKLKKIEPGHYESEDGRVVIQRYGKYWSLYIKDTYFEYFDTLRDAKRKAERTP